jgi:hypothetical protein
LRLERLNKVSASAKKNEKLYTIFFSTLTLKRTLAKYQDTMSDSIAVKKYSLSGQFRGSYKSLTSAAKSVYKGCGSDIHDAIKNNTVYKNNKWSYADAPKPSAIIKSTPDTVKDIANIEGKPEFSAVKLYEKNIKSIHVNNIKMYLDEYENNKSNCYIILPELLNYLVANPTLMIYNKKFYNTVTTKMTEFKTQIDTVDILSGFKVTEGYREEIKNLILNVERVLSFYSIYSQKYN